MSRSVQHGYPFVDFGTDRAVADTLRTVRLSANLSARALGRRIGLSDKTVSSFECQRASTVKFSYILAILQACNWTLEAFIAEIRRATEENAEFLRENAALDENLRRGVLAARRPRQRVQ